MKNKINVTVVIPIHNTETADFEKYFENAIQSIANNDVVPSKVLIIVPASAASNALFTKGHPDLEFEIVANTGNTDFATQMNLAVSKVQTEWFSFLEFDDEYSNLWFRNVEKYMAEYPEVSMFLPIVSDATPDRKFLGYTNEIAWAFEFTDKRGMIDADTLKDYPNFNPDGMVMRTADFNKIGGYKKNIKLAFNLEFLLRACDQGLPIMVIPKIGYQHVNMRPDSLFWTYKNGENKLTPLESEFWMETARKEFYYADDRPILFGVPENKTEQTDAK